MSSETLKTLKSLFNERVYRVPEYQRGYSWGKQQLAEFWDDLINIKDKPHYTGVLTLRKIDNKQITSGDDAFSLVNIKNYTAYDIVDGQQRITTAIILLKAILEFVEENNFKTDTDGKIYFSEDDDSDIATMQRKFLYKTDRNRPNNREFLFLYKSDDASSEYFKHEIMSQPDGGKLKDTLYTNNLKDAKEFFKERLMNEYKTSNDDKVNENKIKNIFNNLISKITFYEFIIPENFDVNVAFESMNNRGKRLSTLELLKNRLLYLVSLYDDNSNSNLNNDITRTKKNINDAWAEIYAQLGKDKDIKLLDDDYLKCHWIIYWTYTRKTGTDYIEFLLKKKFVRNNVYINICDEEQLQSDWDNEADSDERNLENEENDEKSTQNENHTTIDLDIINDYAESLKSCVSRWVDTHYPELSNRSDEIKVWLDKLNRIGLRYFRPLVTVILKKCDEKKITENDAINIFKNIERFIFISFFTTFQPKNYKDSYYYECARKLNKDEITLYEINNQIIIDLKNDSLNEDDNSVIFERWERKIKDSFTRGNKWGFYSWIGLQYLLFEYELYLSETLGRDSRAKGKARDLFTNKNDKKISIEHIYPQTDDNPYWIEKFKDKTDIEKSVYKGSLGNLLLLSMRINAQLQNDSFDDKKVKRIDKSTGTILRSGYAEGTLSEIEVSQKDKWTSTEILKRSGDLVTFMQNRWHIKIRDEDCEKIKNPNSLLKKFSENIKI